LLRKLSASRLRTASADSAPDLDIPAAALAAPGAASRQILTFTYFTFVCYLSIGLPLAILPAYVHLRMGFSAVLAGLVISVQYIATFVSRPWAGRISDRQGAKVSVLWGMGACTASGFLLLAAVALHSIPWLSFAGPVPAGWHWEPAKASDRPAQRCGASPAPARKIPPRSSLSME
jgi:hypothetical protein